MSHRSPEVWIGEDVGTLAREGARRIAEAARKAQNARGRFLLVLAGGNTPRRLYKVLSAEEHGIDWGRVVLFFGDERMVPPDDPESNYRMARETLLDHVPINPENVHRIRTELSKEDAVAHYEATLRRVLAGDETKEPRLDMVLLGMGPDGHTASIFPGSKLLSPDEQKSKPQALCQVVENAPKPPPTRITMTPWFINTARQVLVLVSGEDKVAAAAAALESDAEPTEIPIRAIFPESGGLSWLLDRKAARALTNAPR